MYEMKIGIDHRDWVGRVIDDRFPLLEWLGDSDCGSVFLTELHGAGSQKAAIKLIFADGVDADARLRLWEKTAPLSHPHLMRLFHAGSCHTHTGDLLYAVTEFAGENLAQILPERPLTPVEAGQMLPPVLDALAYLHGKGLVHSRLKPSNILVVEDQIKLSCDGLQLAGSHAGKTPAPTIYDAPECVGGTITPAADLWALGVTLVEALSQHPPLWDRSAAGDPAVPESIPEPFAGIARECLRSDPARRCTLGACKANLRATQPFTQSLAKLRWALLAAALLALAIFAFLHLRPHQAKTTTSDADDQSAMTPQPTATPNAKPSPNGATKRNPAPASTSTPAPVQAPAPAPVSQSSTSAVVKGTVAAPVLPNVPSKASATIHGKVEVTVRVSADPMGTVTSAELTAPAASPYFSKLALEAARRWQFKPARDHGQAVSSEWMLRFHFTPAGPAVTPIETAP